MSPNGKALPVISLFTGAGGLDLGLEASGFSISCCVEIDADSRTTLKFNRPNWKLADPGDIHRLTPSGILNQAGLKCHQVSVVTAGPPCQPFSKAAYWSNGDSRRLKDPRALTIRACLKVIDAALPRVVLLENVTGFVFNGKDEGLQLLQREFRNINQRRGSNYCPQIIHLNAAAYGVPQFRERIFILASIDGRNIQIPAPTHGDGPGLQPYCTAWDAIGDLQDVTDTDLNLTGKWAELLPSIPEGRNYLWHTDRNVIEGGEPLFGWRSRYWSFLLKLAKARPSWTIQAAPGPATGPFHWKNRLLSIPELCRLQTFPEAYRIYGNRRSAQSQLGNAVPSAIGELLGKEIRRQLFGHRISRHLSLIPKRRPNCPRRESLRQVPRRYLNLRGQHRDHPGPGLGPGALRRSGA